MNCDQWRSYFPQGGAGSAAGVGGAPGAAQSDLSGQIVSPYDDGKD